MKKIHKTRPRTGLRPAGPRWIIERVQFSWVNFSRLASRLRRSARREITILWQNIHWHFTVNHHHHANPHSIWLKSVFNRWRCQVGIAGWVGSAGWSWSDLDIYIYISSSSTIQLVVTFSLLTEIDTLHHYIYWWGSIVFSPHFSVIFNQQFLTLERITVGRIKVYINFPVKRFHIHWQLL